MTIKEMRCKNCGAVLQDISTTEVQYCSYCGTPLYFDDEVSRTEQTINRTTTIRDEARLKEAENEARRLDLEERRLALEERRAGMGMTREYRDRKNENCLAPVNVFKTVMLVLFIIFICIFTLGYVASPLDAMSGSAIDDIIIIFLVVNLVKRLSKNL